MNEETSKKVISACSLETTLVYQRLQRCEREEVVTYKELTDLIGRNIQAYRTPLTSATRKMLNYDNVDFQVVRGLGIKRVNDTEIVNSSDSTFVRIRRTALKKSKQLACVEKFNDLTEELKAKHNASLSVLGAIRQFSKRNTIKKIEGKVREAGATLPVAKTIKLFME